MRESLWAGVKVILAEIVEFILQTRFAPRGSLERIYGEWDGI